MNQAAARPSGAGQRLLPIATAPFFSLPQPRFSLTRPGTDPGKARSMLTEGYRQARKRTSMPASFDTRVPIADLSGFDVERTHSGGSLQNRIMNLLG